MPAAAMIRADGVDWPLATFLDAYGYRQVDPVALPVFDGQARFAVVTLHGELEPPRYASEIRWWDALAFRPIEHGPEGEPCRFCGQPVGRTDDDICEPCEDSAEWDW
jgi:hypothetical protein